MEYSCPMHMEIRAEGAGKCPKCGMKLVPSGSADSASGMENPSYSPLLIIIGLITLVTAAVAYSDIQNGAFSIKKSMSDFMAGFLLVFAGFKLLDLRGFAQSYSTYDLLARKASIYGYIYPFLELALGICYLVRYDPALTNSITLSLMLFSGMGVALALAKRRKFQCACLGTAIKLPLSSVTLIEDFGMAVMALLSLVL